MYSVLIKGVMLTSSLFNVGVFQDEVATSEAVTEGKISVKADTQTPWSPEEGLPNIKDPNTPNDKDKEGKPEDGEGSTGNGTQAFHIDWISNFDFGEVTLTGESQVKDVLPVTFNGAKLPPFAQVTDNLGAGGWTLSVKSDLWGDNQEQAHGMQIALKTKPLSKTVSGVTDPKVSNEQQVITGESVDVATATNAAGVYNLSFEGTQLQIPAQTEKADYTTKLTWVFSETP